MIHTGRIFLIVQNCCKDYVTKETIHCNTPTEGYRSVALANDGKHIDEYTNAMLLILCYIIPDTSIPHYCGQCNGKGKRETNANDQCSRKCIIIGSKIVANQSPRPGCRSPACLYAKLTATRISLNLVR